MSGTPILLLLSTLGEHRSEQEFKTVMERVSEKKVGDEELRNQVDWSPQRNVSQ